LSKIQYRDLFDELGLVARQSLFVRKSNSTMRLSVFYTSDLHRMKFDFEERLLRFGVSVLDLSEKIADGKAANHLSSQLIRSATAPPLMYGEVNAAESPGDFVHNMSIVLKELRETRTAFV